MILLWITIFVKKLKIYDNGKENIKRVVISG